MTEGGSALMVQESQTNVVNMEDWKKFKAYWEARYPPYPQTPEWYPPVWCPPAWCPPRRCPRYLLGMNPWWYYEPYPDHYCDTNQAITTAAANHAAYEPPAHAMAMVN